MEEADRRPPPRQTATKQATPKPPTADEIRCEGLVRIFAEDALLLQEYGQNLDTAAAAGDLTALQLAYISIEGMIETMPHQMDMFFEDCTGVVAIEPVVEMRSALRVVERQWLYVKRDCENDLASLGFTCD